MCYYGPVCSRMVLFCLGRFCMFFFMFSYGLVCFGIPGSVPVWSWVFLYGPIMSYVLYIMYGPVFLYYGFVKFNTVL